MIERAREVLRDVFGFEEFLSGQQEIVDHILAGRDGLAVMPTGGGKSLCYQLPGLVKEGVTLVVSPLIALMKDQVDALQAKGVKAAVINSTQSWEEQKQILDEVRAGEIKLLYVAPERFRAGSFTSAMSQVNIAMLAIDEAHCLSQWGHDFRPDYLRLGKARKELGNPQCVAFTATATPVVRLDILKVLALDDPFETITGFGRPNLSFNITAVSKKADKYKRLREIILEYKTGIIYCATRKKVDEVSETLASWGLKVAAYHGGMSDKERDKVQDSFISRRKDVAVATNAFGMGIDRSDVRFVAHFEVPGSVEAFYQEAGRAGRDGEAAWCELLWNFADTRTQEFFLEGVNPGPGVVRDLYQWLRSSADSKGEVFRSLDEMRDELGVSNGMAVGSALSLLARIGYVQRFDVPGQRLRGTRLLKPNEPLELDEAAMEEKERRDRQKLDSMIALCESGGCRQEWILDYFGEEGRECGTCDVCRSGQSGDKRDLTEPEKLIVKKALSGVARMSERLGRTWQPRFGRGKIILMLTGSQSQEIMNAGLNRLSTYGILKEEGAAFLNELFPALADAGLVQTIRKGDYPLMILTERGHAVMMGKREVRLSWPSRKVASASDEGPFDSRVYSRLADLRTRLCKEEGCAPYMVLSNRALEGLARALPKTINEALEIPGIGPAKAGQYGEQFLAIIREMTD
ncbi:ATP-dependent DNA helicase RecQ [Roseibacillus persicicus]|uniref:ATP-dependent DNA helicase RecQ n=1 Tax=Roseibacillus persicicus TaxID=454148 RepID=UPI00281029D3|nr:ATP-dependent DNA helicase RecQ [Roseibacillus persicicus]MDQ8191997.1 ATP-dependent DNA helicase [Roseibacillus persicicus]